MPINSVLKPDLPRSQALRSQIESALASRFAGALTPAPRTIREVATTGIAEIDAMLSGGLPVGAISELVGPECSGRMSTALAFAAQRTNEGRVVAWVDVGDGFDPESAAANGVGLSQLLWVRCSEAVAFRTQSEKTNQKSAFLESPLVTRDTRDDKRLQPRTVTRIQHGCAGQHPRSEVKGMDAAIEKLLHVDPPSNKYGFFTPPSLNQPLEVRKSGNTKSKTRPFGSVTRNEQVSTDRQSSVRSKYVVEHNPSDCEAFCPRCAEAAYGPRPKPTEHKLIEPAAGAFNAQLRFRPRSEQKPWTRFDQALRATDLLLQAGGFSAIVLDLGGIAPEHVARIPLASWFRFRQAADVSRTSLLVLSQTTCAKSSAAVVLQFGDLAVSGSTVVDSVRFEAGSSRQRFAPASFAPAAPRVFDMATTRKPPQATWQSGTYSPVREETGG